MTYVHPLPCTNKVVRNLTEVTARLQMIKNQPSAGGTRPIVHNSDNSSKYTKLQRAAFGTFDYFVGQSESPRLLSLKA